jgi:hypothetical protein
VFTIEYVIVQGRLIPDVVEKITSGAMNLAGASAAAKSLLNGVRQRQPETPPDGYQIRDNDGLVILRSWETGR